MDSLRNRLVIVTNASTDIGVAIVEKLANNGMKVLGLDTEVEHLENISTKLQGAKGTFQYYVTDLSSEHDIAKAISWSKSNIGPTHVLINIPSTHFQNNLPQENIEYLQQVFDLDFIGLNLMTKKVAKNMMMSDTQSHIVFVSPPSQNSVSKSIGDCVRQSVENLMEVLRCELDTLKSKIKVTILRHSNGKHNSTLRPSDIAETINYVLSMPSHLQMDTLTLSAV